MLQRGKKGACIIGDDAAFSSNDNMSPSFKKKLPVIKIEK